MADVVGVTFLLEHYKGKYWVSTLQIGQARLEGEKRGYRQLGTRVTPEGARALVDQRISRLQKAYDATYVSTLEWSHVPDDHRDRIEGMTS